MSAFRFTATPIDGTALRAELIDTHCGGFTCFEGWVRDHNEGQQVLHLEYEAFEALGVREGERIVHEACEKYGVTRVVRAPAWRPAAAGDRGVGGRGRRPPRRGFQGLPLHHR